MELDLTHRNLRSKEIGLCDCTFRTVSEIAIATQFGQTAIETMFNEATIGAAQMAKVTPETVRMRPCTRSLRQKYYLLRKGKKKGYNKYFRKFG